MCPLTNTLMLEPVIDEDGNIFESDAIEYFIKEHRFHPINLYDVSRLIDLKLRPHTSRISSIERHLKLNPDDKPSQFEGLCRKIISRLDNIKDILSKYRSLDKELYQKILLDISLINFLNADQLKIFFKMFDDDGDKNESIEAKIFSNCEIIDHCFKTLETDINLIKFKSIGWYFIHKVVQHMPGGHLVKVIKKYGSKYLDPVTINHDYSFKYFDINAKTDQGASVIQVATAFSKCYPVSYLLTLDIDLDNTYGDDFLTQNLCYLIEVNLSHLMPAFKIAYNKKYGVDPVSIDENKWVDGHVDDQ